jgi:hypothetical protein
MKEGDTKLRRLATSLVKKMFRGNDDIIDVAYRIHKWGSKSVHQGQIVPISVIWFSLFSIWNKLPPMFRAATPLSPSKKITTSYYIITKLGRSKILKFLILHFLIFDLTSVISNFAEKSRPNSCDLRILVPGKSFFDSFFFSSCS